MTDFVLELEEGQPIEFDFTLGSPVDFSESEYIPVPDSGIYSGAYEVTPSFEEQTLPTAHKTLVEDVTVHAIEVSRTTNPSGGITVYIGGII